MGKEGGSGEIEVGGREVGRMEWERKKERSHGVQIIFI